MYFINYVLNTNFINILLTLCIKSIYITYRYYMYSEQGRNLRKNIGSLTGQEKKYKLVGYTIHIFKHGKNDYFFIKNE